MPKRERWQVAGNAAEIYQRELVPAVFGPWAPRVVELAQLQPGLRVLDVACGTGVVARLAAEKVGVDGRVAALDLNPGMLAVAAQLAAVEGAPIEWIEGTVERAGLRDCAIRAATGNVRFTSAATFVHGYVGGSPLAALVAAAPAPAYEELLREVERGTDSLIEQSSLSFPIEAHLALCHA
jgi:SAM-dependent methyltransferase